MNEWIMSLITRMNNNMIHQELHDKTNNSKLNTKKIKSKGWLNTPNTNVKQEQLDLDEVRGGRSRRGRGFYRDVFASILLYNYIYSTVH